MCCIDRLKSQSLAALCTTSRLMTASRWIAEQIEGLILEATKTAIGRGCVKTISLFLSVEDRSIKNIFSQCFTPLTHLWAKKPSKPATIYHSDFWNLSFHTASATSGTDPQRKPGQKAGFFRSSLLSWEFYGVYQIGEVYARSWWLNGTSASILLPKNAMSYACQVGVGISITRA